MKKILALIDWDQKGKQILDASFRMAGENKADLLIYHHLNKEEKIEINKDTFSIENESKVTDHSKALEVKYGIDPVYSFSSGNFKKSIIKLVEEEGIDLIIMGSDGISDTKERILGSHAQVVMENVTCSVLVLKEEALKEEIKEVVFASSFNEMDKEVFTYFLDFMKLPEDVLIHLLMVDTYSFFNQPGALVNELFKDFKALAKPYTAKAHFFHGISVEDGINKFMNKENADLLIMSNKYSRLIRTALSGSKMVATLHENQYPFLNIDYKKTADTA